MKFTDILVDEGLAKELLEKNRFYDRTTTSDQKTNRPVSKLRVQQYASAMLRGEWVKTHQGIAVDTNGNLLDGQHRLLAVEQAAKTNPDIEIPFTLIEDADPETFGVIDTHNVRSGKDILALRGERDTLNLHASVRHLFLYLNVDHFSWNRTRVTNAQIMQTLEEHPGIRDEIPLAKSFQVIGLTTTAGTVGLYVCRSATQYRMEEFIDGIRTGVGLEARDPRLALRNNLIRGKSMNAVARRYDTTKIQMATFIKTWNDFQNGREREIIRWHAGERFPVPKPPISATEED